MWARLIARKFNKNTGFSMILIGIGANLPHPQHGPALQTCVAALAQLDRDADIRVAEVSRWFESAPVPVSDQPWFINGVARLETGLSANALLKRLHALEHEFGRARTGAGAVKNAARVLDLDLLDFDGQILNGPKGPVLPHARMDGRAFVLLPLADIAPLWCHPATGDSLDDLIRALGPDQVARPLDGTGQSKMP